MPHLTEKAQRELNEEVDNYTEAFRLLDLINAEFQSDPLSTQCFDARIVERVKACVAKRKEVVKKQPWLVGE